MPRQHDRCTGHCCEKFTIPLSPEQLAQAYTRWLGRGTEPLTMNNQTDSRLYQDIHLIAPMLVYLGYRNKESPKVNPNDNELLGKPNDKAHYYRCKHFDPKTRDCTIYEIRPAMCRNYPNSGVCNYAKCTWKAKRAKKQTKAELRRRLKKLTSVEVVEKPKG